MEDNDIQRQNMSTRTMTEQDLQKFIEGMARLRKEHAASPEKARQFLKDSGYLTEDGEVAYPYAPDKVSQS